MNNIENQIQKIDRELEELKTDKTEDLKKRLIESAAHTANIGYQLLGDKYLNFSRKKAPVPLPTLEAQKYRDKVMKLVAGAVPIKDQISTLRQKRQDLRAQAPQRARESRA